MHEKVAFNGQKLTDNMAHFAKDVDNFSAARTVRIVGSENIENYTLYTIEVTLGPYSWTVRHRYSDFFDLHEKLVSSWKLEKNLLPPKKLFGNQSEAFIKKRQGDLETYLQTIMYFLVNKLPPPLAAFLDFNRYEIHGVTHSMAEELYSKGDTILQAKETYTMTPLQLYALTERLKLPEPTCDSGDLKKDIGHILDFITRLKYLKIVGTRDPVGSSNIDMNLLKFDLTLFKSLKSLEILNGNVLKIQGLETVKETLQRLEVHHSIRAVRDILLQELPHWRSEDGTMLLSAWEQLTAADFSHNNILTIDDSVQLLPNVELLDLSHNTIESINHVQWLSQLTHLNLSQNTIRHLDSLHTKLGNLKTLNLSGNKLESLQGFSKLFSLEVLNVCNNEISQIVEVSHISSLPCLEKVLLLGNPVTIIPDYRNKVLEIFQDRASEIVLDNRRATQKELDTVAVLHAIQLARESKDNHRRPHLRKAVVAEVPILEPECGPQMSSSQDSTTAVIGWSVTDPHCLSSDPDVFRLQVEAIREQGGEAWLALLNELQTSPIHRQQARDLLSSLSLASPEAQRMSGDSLLSISSPTSTVQPSSRAPSTHHTPTSLQTGHDHHHTGHRSHRPKSVSSLIPPEGYSTRFIDQDKLPGIEDVVFVRRLQGQLLSVELMFNSSQEDTEQIREILWCYAIQYAHPSDKQVACVALTDRHIFVQRLKGVIGKVNAAGSITLPETETFYIMPLSNIQKVVIGRENNFVRLEESFVGSNGTFALIGLDSKSVQKFVTKLLSLYRESLHSGDGLQQPDVQDMSRSGVEDLKQAISNTEKIPDPKDIHVIFSCMTFVSSRPSCLVITDHTLYIFTDHCVQYPPPTFELSTSLKAQYSVYYRYPVMTKMQAMELFNSSGKGLLDKTSYTSVAHASENVQFEHYGISLTLDVGNDVTETVEIIFLISTMRDEFLERLTQVRFDHAQKLSPTHRGEPEGGNETSETDSEKESKELTPDIQGIVSPAADTPASGENPAPAIEPPGIYVLSSSGTPISPEITEGHGENSPVVTRKSVRSFTALELVYPGSKLVNHLSECLSKYSLLNPLPPKMEFLKAMTGKDLVTFFHNNLAEIGLAPEELRHVIWAHVVPYCNPRQEILSLVLLSTRAVYMLSHDRIKGKQGRPSWMTHERHKSDSHIGRHKYHSDSHHTSGILNVGTNSSRILKPFKILSLSDIKLVNVGLFDQYFRLTGLNEENVATVVTRNCYVTGEFVKQLTQVLSLVSSSPTPDLPDEPDFYRSFAQRTKSTVEGLEYTLPSKVRFCYPGEESLNDLTYLINDSLSSGKSHTKTTHIWIYLQGFAFMGPFSENVQSKLQPRGIILTDQHLCLIMEDVVSYPLPEFVRGLPECPRHQVIEGRNVEYLKSVTLHNENALSLHFSDETEDITVDTSFEHYGVERAVKGRQSPPEVTWTLFIQSIREREKFIKLLSRQWSEGHDGSVLIINDVVEENPL